MQHVCIHVPESMGMQCKPHPHAILQNLCNTGRAVHGDTLSRSATRRDGRILETPTYRTIEHERVVHAGATVLGSTQVRSESVKQRAKP